MKKEPLTLTVGGNILNWINQAAQVLGVSRQEFIMMNLWSNMPKVLKDIELELEEDEQEVAAT